MPQTRHDSGSFAPAASVGFVTQALEAAVARFGALGVGSLVGSGWVTAVGMLLGCFAGVEVGACSTVASAVLSVTAADASVAEAGAAASPASAAAAALVDRVALFFAGGAASTSAWLSETTAGSVLGPAASAATSAVASEFFGGRPRRLAATGVSVSKAAVALAVGGASSVFGAFSDCCEAVVAACSVKASVGTRELFGGRPRRLAGDGSDAATS